MDEEESAVDSSFRLFAKPKTRLNPKPASNPSPDSAADASDGTGKIEKVRDAGSAPAESTFAELGLRESLQQTCNAMGMKRPTPVQVHCIPKILAGRDVLGLAQTGSGKTAAFALPILHRLDEERYGVFALVITPTRELAYQLSEQFKALGSALHVRCSVVVGGMDMLTQAKSLTARPHIVISTPGRIRVLLEDTPDIPPVFANTKFLVLDEADRVLDSGFEDELKAVFKCLPKNRQTLLFSATMTSNLQTLLEVSGNKAYFYEAYEGLQTVETLNQQYVFISKDIKELFLVYLLSKMDELGIRSAIIFVSTCRGCHHLSLLLEELEQEAAALHSFKSQSLRLAALNQFKSRKVPILLTTDVANRGLDIPTVDLVVNFDIPRDPRDYVHRVGRTARAGRGGRAISFVTQKDIDLVKEIEAKLGKQLKEFEYKENEVLEESKKVSNAKRVASMKMMDDGFDEKQKERKQQKLRTLAQKGLLKKKQRSQKRKRSNKTEES